ncbi:MAG: hypothetical protein N3D73_03325, partial [Candidatus Diapherotrites archaeon]|nr:hypothetical protein [Candidatus Diapherotrites archaeon]
MVLDFDEIKRIYKLETSSLELVRLPYNFYNNLIEFIKNQPEISHKSKDKRTDFSSISQTIYEILSIRKKKIISRALIYSPKESTSLGLMPHEKKLYEAFVREIESYDEFLRELLNMKVEKIQKDLNIVYVKILSDIPSFIGADMKNYGPFKQGEEISLPYETAKLLTKRNI